jgi:CRP-like cAMP-binding protein
MFDIFRNYLKARAVISESDFKKIEAFSISKKIRKRQYLLQEGDIWRHAAFICSGCLRVYRLTEEGTEHIMRFAIEDWWVGDRESYTTGLAAKSYIDALEDSEVLMWAKENFETLLKEIPGLKAFSEDLLAKSFNASQNRIYAAISYTAEEKYFNFIKTYPDIFNRVPLQMIASYLGVSRETLSRIRKSFAHK